MTSYVDRELQKCYNLFALCYAKEAPVPPAWIEYHDALIKYPLELPLRPVSKEYPCRWVDAWRGWMQLSKMDLASGVARYISTLPTDQQVLARIEIERSRWWFETNSYFVRLCEEFRWKEDEIDYFFKKAKALTKDV
jgi:hypothetical protein